MTDLKDCEFEYRSMANYESYAPWVRGDQLWHKNVPDYIPKSINYPKLRGLYCLLKNAASKYPDNNAVIYEPFSPKERKYTYSEVSKLADKSANALLELGVKKGDAVALFTPNIPEFLWAYFGCLEIGAAVVPINPLLKKKEVLHVFSNTNKEEKVLDTLIVHESLLSVVKRTVKQHPIKNIVVVEEEKPVDDAYISFNKIVEKAPDTFPDIKFDIKKTIAALMYTGGTTGLPKGVMLSQDNILKNTFQAALDLYTMDKAESLIGNVANIAVLPLCHIFGLFMVGTTMAGAYLNIMMKFDAERVLKAIQEYKAFMISGVPTHFQLLAACKNFDKYDISSLELVTSAGAALASAIAKKYREKNVIVKMGYGLTECSPATHLQPDWLKYNPESIGIPIVDTDVRIVDPTDFSKDVEIGQAGELLIRGPQTCMGYWKNEEATKSILLDDGWLRTGDIARYDESGYFYIVGRSKEQIKYKGYRILPFEVENTLFEHPAVADCAVIGIPDDVVGEIIKAYVKIKPEYKGKVTEQEIIDWAKENMAGYKWPRQLEFISSIPKSPVGKTLRRGLREKAIKDKQK
ncbi:MAG: class I adenylate-forming enzyme family protein [Candidatus Helarchaeota archaeon]